MVFIFWLSYVLSQQLFHRSCVDCKNWLVALIGKKTNIHHFLFHAGFDYVHSRSLTWPLKSYLPVVFQASIFRGYVKLRGVYPQDEPLIFQASNISPTFSSGKLTSRKTFSLHHFPVVLANFWRGFWFPPLWLSIWMALRYLFFCRNLLEWICSCPTCFHRNHVGRYAPGKVIFFQGVRWNAVVSCFAGQNSFQNAKEIHRLHIAILR